ncbi:hypothetical protein ACWGK1_18655 [Streptomyces wedmorensis]
MTITNHSGLPILDVRISRLDLGMTPRSWWPEQAMSGTLRADDNWVWEAPQDMQSDLDMRTLLVSGWKPVATLLITDASGVQWFRTGSRQPERVVEQ